MPAQPRTINPLQVFSLNDRVALIPGGGGAIGSALGEALGGAGASVAIVSKTADHAREAAERVQATGSAGLAIAADVTRRSECERVVAETVQRFGRLDIIINAVGGGAGKVLHAAEEYPQDAWDWIFDLNLKSAIEATQAAVRAMIKGGRGGRVLNISSVRGQLGINAGYSAYVAAKGALNALTRQWATEWAKHQITVNAIAPTFIDTPQVASLLADESFKQGLINRIPLRRVGTTQDLIGPALFFCSDASAYVTGQVLPIDGGLTATQ